MYVADVRHDPHLFDIKLTHLRCGSVSLASQIGWIAANLLVLACIWFTLYRQRKQAKLLRSSTLVGALLLDGQFPSSSRINFCHLIWSFQQHPPI